MKHGHKPKHSPPSPTYTAWLGAKARCKNVNGADFPNYGGRGIKVCERWNNFVNFLADMGEKPKGMMLERINNDGPYCPENCKWATRTEQNNNTRKNVFLTHEGRTQTLAQWAKELGLNDKLLYERISRKWSFQKALSLPAAIKHRRHQ